MKSCTATMSLVALVVGLSAIVQAAPREVSLLESQVSKIKKDIVS